MNTINSTLLIYGIVMLSFGLYLIYYEAPQRLFILFLILMGMISFYAYYLTLSKPDYAFILLYAILGLHFIIMACLEWRKLHDLL